MQAVGRIKEHFPKNILMPENYKCREREREDAEVSGLGDLGNDEPFPQGHCGRGDLCLYYV